jgi:CelD/BcsL family acetyltransferase involved in cellulose biosynthesis
MSPSSGPSLHADHAAHCSQCDDENRLMDTTEGNVHVLGAHELCGDLEQQWQSLRQFSKFFSSPYFDANFIKAVAKVRQDVRIVMVEENGVPVCFLPIQENSKGHAVPAGGRLNDYHGILGKPEQTTRHFKRMLKSANLKSYSFHALVPPNDPRIQPFAFRQIQTHHLDLSNGWDAYQKWVRRHSSTVKRQGQKTRNLEKDFGPIRFEFDTADGNVLEKLIELKRAKYQRTKTFDILSVDWAANLLRELHHVKKTNFQGILQAMWAGDDLVCVHFGMVTDEILHYWFPIYDFQFSRYSPGTEMMMRVAQDAASRGIKMLDLGYGDDPWKFKFCNGNQNVTNGQINFNPLELKLAQKRYELRTKLKQVPLKPLMKTVLRSVFPGFGNWNFK